MKNPIAAAYGVLLMMAVSCAPPVEQINEQEIIDSVVTALELKVKLLEEAKEGFDAELAAELGADQYGMASYVIAFLKRGPNRDMSEEEAMELQTAHLNNIQRLADEGVLVVAGPFMGAGDMMGIYIFDVETIEEALELTASDPAIKRGSLVMELHKWYGSAAMKEINNIHSKIMAKSVTE